jgi:hypothetical protein
MHGAVSLLTFHISTVNLDERGIIDVASKSSVNSLKIWFVAIARQLHAVCEMARKVFHEGPGCDGIASTEKERWNELRFGVDSDPRPHVTAMALREFLRRNLLFLCIRRNSTPNLPESTCREGLPVFPL